MFYHFILRVTGGQERISADLGKRQGLPEQVTSLQGHINTHSQSLWRAISQVRQAGELHREGCVSDPGVEPRPLHFFKSSSNLSLVLYVFVFVDVFVDPYPRWPDVHKFYNNLFDVLTILK